MIELLKTSGLLLGASWASGVNLYMTLAGLGIAHRMHAIELPGGLEVISNPFIIALAIALYLVEFVADKVPYVDSVWDSVHTFIRPFGMIVLSYAALSGADPVIRTAVSLICGTVTLDSHLVKATTRLAINTSPEPVSNSVASVTEDGLVVGVLVLISKHPIIAAIVVILFFAFSVWFLVTMFRFLKKLFRPSQARPAARS
ncbi:MAG TPA: DUF4126 domain-containing protein [bacterium]|nr:DUF4126 domain-containing protein [bacterium]